MSGHSTDPRVLIVTSEIACLPKGVDNHCQLMKAKTGGLTDVSATLINTLCDQGADVHIAFPDYRYILNGHLRTAVEESLHFFERFVPNDRIHLARDRAFYYLSRKYSCYGADNIKISLAFQREVMNNIIPLVQPDLIHCNDWMTGLIPAMARQSGIPCLFTVHNIHTEKTTLAEIEDRGIDAAFFWENLYYDYFPSSYENTRQSTPVDFLASGVFASNFVNTVSPTFLTEMVDGLQGFVKRSLQQELSKFNHHVTAQRYIEFYEKILKRPLISNNTHERNEKAKKHRMKTHPAQDHIDPISVMPFSELFERSDFEIYQKKGGPHGTADHQL